MADNDEDDSQKTEEPTQRRIEDALKRGQSIFSREITNFALLLVLTLVVIFLIPLLSYDTSRSLQYYIEHSWDIALDAASLRRLFIQALLDCVAFLTLPLLAMIAAALGSSLLQNQGFVFSAESILPKLEKISPFKGLKRLFSMQSLVDFLKGIVKMIIVGWVSYIAVAPHLDLLKQSHTVSIGVLLRLLLTLTTNMLIGVCVAMFFIAIADYLYQRYSFYQKLRMTKQEVKEEMRQAEGSPEIKSKLRSLRMSRAKKRMMAAVPKADVVITNPTHFSIALRYDAATMQAPVVVAKGVDHLALMIREIAKEHHIPLVANPPLARALYELAEIDQEIPIAHYQAVAEIISYVFNLKNKSLG